MITALIAFVIIVASAGAWWIMLIDNLRAYNKCLSEQLENIVACLHDTQDRLAKMKRERDVAFKLIEDTQILREDW